MSLKMPAKSDIFCLLFHYSGKDRKKQTLHRTSTLLSLAWWQLLFAHHIYGSKQNSMVRYSTQTVSSTYGVVDVDEVPQLSGKNCSSAVERKSSRRHYDLELLLKVTRCSLQEPQHQVLTIITYWINSRAWPTMQWYVCMMHPDPTDHYCRQWITALCTAVSLAHANQLPTLNNILKTRHSDDRPVKIDKDIPIILCND